MTIKSSLGSPTVQRDRYNDEFSQIRLRAVSKHYDGDGSPIVLRNINLDIAAGEMVAIIGASGSGKSTLLNIIGCLDQPSSGSYCLSGNEIVGVGKNQLATIRGRNFGFVFQSYQLLNDLNALENVKAPTIYASYGINDSHHCAIELLCKLGLGDRLTHRPSQLSGGQQQRVSIARALINGAPVILADEPTGALDSAAGESLLDLLVELNRRGQTIVIVTHDPKIASRSPRIIEIEDGLIKSDQIQFESPHLHHGGITRQSSEDERFDSSKTSRGLVRLLEMLKLAGRSLFRHKLRSALTMLGVIVGVASVVCVVAIGEGSKRQVARIIDSLSPNATLEIYPDSSMQDVRDGVGVLTEQDVDAVNSIEHVRAASPVISISGSVRFNGALEQALIRGVGKGYFVINGNTVVDGVSLDASDVVLNSQNVVIDVATKASLFPNQSAVGNVILINEVPFKIVGVVQPKFASFSLRSRQLEVFIPYSSSMARVTGLLNIQRISVGVSRDVPLISMIHAVKETLKARHGKQDFEVSGSNLAEGLSAQAGDAITWFAAAVAAISLIVGGIGVMNVMMVSVVERTREIGIRAAIGARPADIRIQFLAESILICLIGGAIGVALSTAVTAAMSHLSLLSRYPELSVSFFAVGMALMSTLVVGIVFGFIPAARAARLNPTEALASA